MHWGGDPGCTFDDMAASLRGALSWILSGAAFASFDMGGFFGIPTLTDPPSPELYVRWSQMGLLFSHARAHGHTAPREPWAFGEPALSIFRKYAQLRYRLLPYLYSAARRAPERVPLARPLVFDYPADPATWHVDDEYLLGPDLLVAPMFKPRGSRDIYLPAGAWYDFWTDQRFDGGRRIARDCRIVDHQRVGIGRAVEAGDVDLVRGAGGEKEAEVLVVGGSVGPRQRRIRERRSLPRREAFLARPS